MQKSSNLEKPLHQLGGFFRRTLKDCEPGLCACCVFLAKVLRLVLFRSFCFFKEPYTATYHSHGLITTSSIEHSVMIHRREHMSMATNRWQPLSSRLQRLVLLTTLLAAFLAAPSGSASAQADCSTFRYGCVSTLLTDNRRGNKLFLLSAHFLSGLRVYAANHSFPHPSLWSQRFSAPAAQVARARG